MHSFTTGIRLSTSAFYLFLLALVVVSPGARSQGAASLTIGQEQKLVSQALGEERSYLISLPISYEKDAFYRQKRYPVLVLLDADTHFRYASSMIHFLSAGETEQLPEMIVVGIRNTARTRDMTAGLQADTDPFLTFLEKELLPRIDRQYRTLPYRVLAGHSLAGLFAVNGYLDQRAFQAYIALDPTLTWNKGAIVRKAKTVLSGRKALTATFYLAQAGNPLEPGRTVGARGQAFAELVGYLDGRRSGEARHRYVYYPQENHFSVPLQSLRDGLKYVFNQFEFPFSTFLSRGSSGVRTHYQQWFGRLGVNLSPPGKVINQVGLYLLHNQKQADQAIELLTVNADYFPDSPAVFTSLGDAFKAKGDTAKALDCYQKVLRLQPSDEQARKNREALTKRQN